MHSFIYYVWFVIIYKGSKIDDIHPKQLSQGFYGLKRPKKGLYISGHHILHLVRSCITSKNNQKLLYWAHATELKSFWAADNIKYQLNFFLERYFRITISKLISLVASNIFEVCYDEHKRLFLLQNVSYFDMWMGTHELLAKTQTHGQYFLLQKSCKK